MWRFTYIFRLIWWKIRYYPFYLKIKIQRELILEMDWDRNKDVVEYHTKFAEIISTYKTANIRLKYENWIRLDYEYII